MDTQNPSAPPRAQSRVAGNSHPNRQAASRTGGLTHDNTRHTTRFTVIGNHLTQHPDLSLLAIGLACHIQSLPKGARIDIKTLACRFPEGATRIAAALRELEAHGYLRRARERVPGGRIVTRTVSCNQPGTGQRETGQRETGHAPHPPAERPAATTTPKPKAPRRPLPAVPCPGYPAPALLQAATGHAATGKRGHAGTGKGDTQGPGIERIPFAVAHVLDDDEAAAGRGRSPALVGWGA